MKYTTLLALSAIFVSAYGMEEASTRDIIIRNEVGQKVKITYGLVDGKTIESVLANNEAVHYPLEDEVTTFIVRPYGEIKGKVTPESLGMKPKDYAHKVKLVLQQADQNISVVIKQGGLPQEGILATVKTAVEAIMPGKAFEYVESGLKGYVFPYKLNISPQKFEGPKALIPASRKVIDVFPAARTIIERSLDKDKYFSIEPRYILGLDVHSSKENVEAIYKIHKNQWENLIKNPSASKEDVAFAEEVLEVLEDAYQSLILKFKYEDRLMKSK